MAASAAALLGAAVWASGGTGAWWRATDPLGAGSVRAGSLVLTLSGEGVTRLSADSGPDPAGRTGLAGAAPPAQHDTLPSATSESAGGTSAVSSADPATEYLLTGLSTRSLRPGHSAQAFVRVDNEGSVALRYGLRTVTTTSSRLGAALRLVITKVDGPARCGSGPDAAPPPATLGVLYTGQLDRAVVPTRRGLSPGAGEGLCLRVELPGTNNDNTLQGGSTTMTFTFTATTA